MDARSKWRQNNAQLATDRDVFWAMVAERAFLKAEKRGFISGHELDDWLEAEWEISNQCHYWRLEVQ